MKLRLLLIVTLALLAVLYLGIAASWGQFGSEPRNPTQGLELIKDLQPRKAAADDNGRFRITVLTDHTLLLDSRTGDTWVLTENEKLHWLAVPRLGIDEKQAGGERAPHEDPKPGKAFDPFE